MEVKCTRNIIESRLSSLINANLSNYLRINRLYKVYRIRSDANTYYLVYDDSHLIEAPAVMFEIIDNTIPNNWVVFEKDNSIAIGPDFFNSEFWFDDFTEFPEDKRKEMVDSF